MNLSSVHHRHIAEITTSTAVAQDTDVLSEDFQIRGSGNGILIAGMATSANLGLVLVADDGTTISANLNLGDDPLHLAYTVVLDMARTWNLQCPLVGGITISHLVVLEVPLLGININV